MRGPQLKQIIRYCGNTHVVLSCMTMSYLVSYSVVHRSGCFAVPVDRWTEWSVVRCCGRKFPRPLINPLIHVQSVACSKLESKANNYRPCQMVHLSAKTSEALTQALHLPNWEIRLTETTKIT